MNNDNTSTEQTKEPLSAPSVLNDGLGMDRRIVCAANRDFGGQVVCGARHFDLVMSATIKRLCGYTEPWEQGFIDNRGEFLTREQAWFVAEAAGQIIRTCGGRAGVLYSENIY